MPDSIDHPELRGERSAAGDKSPPYEDYEDRSDSRCSSAGFAGAIQIWGEASEGAVEGLCPTKPPAHKIGRLPKKARSSRDVRA